MRAPPPGLWARAGLPRFFPSIGRCRWLARPTTLPGMRSTSPPGAAVGALLLALLPTGITGAAGCDFTAGFAAIAQQIPGAVGQCLGPEQPLSDKGSVQYTTSGALLWRKADNLTAFSDGLRTWLAGPDGLNERDVSNEPAPLMTFDTYNGHVFYQRLDLAVPAPGPGLEFRLSYDSANTYAGPLGPGWAHSFDAHLIQGDGRTSLVLVREDGTGEYFDSNGGPLFVQRDWGPDTLTHQNAGYRADFGNGQYWLFDHNGHVSMMSDKEGHAAVIITDGDGRVTQVIDPAKRGRLTFDYDPTGSRLIAAHDWLGRSVQYGYDDAGRLQVVTDWRGKSTTFVYDGASPRILEVHGADGQLLIANTYDDAGRLATQRDTRRVVPGPPTTVTYDRHPDGTQVTTYSSRGLDGTWRARPRTITTRAAAVCGRSSS